MTREELEGRIRELEAFSRERPGEYHRRVRRIALGGYLFIYGLLLLCLALLAGTVWMLVGSHYGILAFLGAWALGIPAIGIIVTIVQATGMRIPLPEGLPLTRRSAPNLFTAVDALTARLKAPRVHAILLDHTLNAGVFQRPRLGLFGWYRNYLLVGLPLMQALSPEQFGAVIAHEMAHLSGRHGQTGHWIYRLDRMWTAMLRQFSMRRRPGSGLLRRFLRWYVPKLDVYSFVLRRENEYEADRVSAQIAGQHTAAEALMNALLAEAFMSEHFWPELGKRAGESREPPAGIFALLAKTLPRAGQAQRAHKWLRQGLMVETDCDDTHPCLAERLGALGELAQADSRLEAAWNTPGPAALTETAAQRYFGKSLDGLTQTLEKGWRLDVGQRWREMYAQRKEEKRRMGALVQRREYGSLEEREEVELCVLTRKLAGAEQAMGLARELVRQRPGDPGRQFLLGDLMLECKEAGGIEHLEKAMELDVDATFAACDLAHGYLIEAGRGAEAMEYLRRAEKHYALARGAKRERAGLNASDQFEHHGLGGDLVHYLQERLAELDSVAEAFLVRKALKHFRDRPMYVLGLARRSKRLVERMRRDDLYELLAVKMRSFPHSLVVVDLAKSPCAAAIRGVKGGRIHPRRKSA